MEKNDQTCCEVLFPGERQQSHYTLDRDFSFSVQSVSSVRVKKAKSSGAAYTPKNKNDKDDNALSFGFSIIKEVFPHYSLISPSSLINISEMAIGAIYFNIKMISLYTGIFNEPSLVISDHTIFFIQIPSGKEGDTQSAKW